MSEGRRHDKISRQLNWIATKERWSARVLIITGFAAMGALLLFLTYTKPHTHDGYVLAEVLFTSNYASETSAFSLLVHARLPDGTHTIVSTKSLALASSAVEHACLERRKFASGKALYKLAQPTKCQ